MGNTSYAPRRAPRHQSMHGYPVPGADQQGDGITRAPARSRIDARPGGKPSPEAIHPNQPLLDAPLYTDREAQKRRYDAMSPAEKAGAQDRVAADQYRKGRYGDIKTLPAKGVPSGGGDTSTPSAPAKKAPADTPNADRVVRGALDAMSSGTPKSPMAGSSAIRGLKPFTNTFKKSTEPAGDEPDSKPDLATEGKEMEANGVTSRSSKGDVTYKSGAGIVADSGGKRLVSPYGTGGTGRYGTKNNASGDELKQMIADGRANVDPSKRWASGDAKPNPTTPKSPLTLLASVNPSTTKTDATPSAPAQTSTSEQRVAAQQKERDAAYKASLPSQADKEAKWKAEGKDPRVAAIMEKTSPAPGLADLADAQSKKQNKAWNDAEDRSSAIGALKSAQADVDATKPAAVKGIEATGRAAKYVAGGVGSAVTGTVKAAANAVDAGAKLFTGDAAAQEEAKRKLAAAKAAAANYDDSGQ